MFYDPQNFLHSMCLFAASQAASAIEPALAVTYGPLGDGSAAAPFNLFLNQGNESVAADPFGVVRIYGGTHEKSNPAVTASVQLAVYVTPANLPAGMTLANALYRCFCLDNQEKELRTIAVSGFNLADNSSDGSWKLVSARVRSSPGQIGADDRGRLKIVSNFDLTFYKAS